MALLRLESFGHYTRQEGPTSENTGFIKQFARKWATASGIQPNFGIIEEEPTGSGWALRGAGPKSSLEIDQKKMNMAFPLTQTIIIGHRVFFDGLSSGPYLRIYGQVGDLTSAQGILTELRLSIGGELVIRDPVTGHNHSGLFITSQEFNYIEISFTQGTTGAPGPVKLRLNQGDPVTLPAVTTTSDDYHVLQFVHGAGWKIGDLYVVDTSPGVYTDFIGDIQIVPRFPNVDEIVQFTPSDPMAPGNFEMVNDKPILGEVGHGPDEDETTNSSVTEGHRDLFLGDDFAEAGYTVAAVQTVIRGRKKDSGRAPLSPAFRYDKDGTVWEAEGFPHFLSTAYANHFQVFENNPHTGLPWTLEEINCMSFGYKIPVGV